MPWQGQAEPFGKQPAHGPEAERGNLEALQPRSLERALEHRRAGGSRGEQKADLLALQAPRGERESFSRRWIEPLDVVDSDQERRGSRQRAQRVQEPDCDRVRLRRRTRRLRAQESDL